VQQGESWVSRGYAFKAAPGGIQSSG
jgi:hypothetical protein